MAEIDAALPRGHAARGAANRRLGAIAAAVTFVMLLAMTLGTGLSVRAVLQSQSQQRFSDVVESASDSVRSDLGRSFTELAALEGFVRANPAVTDEQFQVFASTVEQRGSTSLSLGYAPRVTSSNAQAFFTGLEQRGFTDRSAGGADIPLESFTVAHTFPPVPGLLEVGTDLGRDPRFGTAVSDSQRSGSIIASSPVTSKTNPSSQPWFLVLHPVFSTAESGSGILGYVFGIYRTADFLAGPLNRSGLDGVPLRVFDHAPGRAASQVFPEFSSSADSTLPPGWVPATVDFAGRRWELQFEAPPLFGLSTIERNVWVIVLSAGLGLTLFASVAMFSLVRARLVAHSDLDLMTSQIRVIVDSAIEAIVVVDRMNRVVWANQSFADAFNLGQPGLLAGKDWTAVRESAHVEFTGRETFLSRLAEISNSLTMTVTAEDIKIKAPVERTLSMTSSPVTDGSEQYLGRLFVFRDVTAERAADDAKSEFVSMVSHELRTPITSMVGYVDLLLDGAAGPLNTESERLLKVVRRNGSRLAHLVADILDLSRIDSMRFRLEPEAVDLRKVLEEISESMAGDFRQKKLSIEVRIPDGLPEVWGDRNRITQIFTNLVSNAHRYTHEGGSVRVEAASLDGQVAVSVSDTGVGIRLEDQSRVFDRFVRLHRGGPRPQGSTGLGLAITKGLVDLHGGSISVESRPGKGSTFTVTLPQADAEERVA